MSPKFDALREAAAKREHGSRARYAGGCRCLLCRAANSRYECERAAARSAGDRRDLVSAHEVVAFIRFLGRQGIGYKSVAAAAGCSPTALRLLLDGHRMRVRRHLASRILSVTKDAVADGALISAAPTWRLIRELLDGGYTRVWIARQLGQRGQGLQLGRERITARNASKVERLYRLIKAGRISR